MPDHDLFSISPKPTPRTLCREFTNTGYCSKPSCPQVHDAAKVALCPSVLLKILCDPRLQCTMNHTWSFHVAPDCWQFLQGCCYSDPFYNPCPFAHHFRHYPWSKTCQQFADLGYCEVGAGCDMLHIRNTVVNETPASMPSTVIQEDGKEQSSSDSEMKRSETEGESTPEDDLGTEGDEEMEEDSNTDDEWTICDTPIEIIIPNGQTSGEFEQQLDFVPF